MSNWEISDSDKAAISRILTKMEELGLEERDLEELTEIAIGLQEKSSGKKIDTETRLEVKRNLEELHKPIHESATDNLDKEIARQERSLGRKLNKEERSMDYFDRQIIVIEHLTGRKLNKEERLVMKTNQDKRVEKEADTLQLHCAAYMGDLNMVKECIEEKGVDVNALAQGNTALFCATQANRQHVIKYLVEKGGKESL